MRERHRSSPAGAPVASSSLQARLVVLFAVAAAVVAIVVAVSAVSFVNLVSARSALVSHVDPANLDADRLFIAYLDEETGVRGYVLSKNPAFLQPYDQGLVEQRSASKSLGTLLSGQKALERDIDLARTQAATWQREWARPAIAAVRANDDTIKYASALLASKHLFDEVRSRFATLDSALAAARNADAHRLALWTDALVAALAAAALVGLIVGVITWLSLRRWVVSPLLRLGADARHVANGELAHPIAGVGPPEIANLGRDVEAMRERIVGEIDIVIAAQAQIATRNEELARSNRELEQFAYVASHDLQEPLRKVTSFVQLLDQRYGAQLDERAAQYMHFAVDGAKRMQVLINDLLAFSRVGRTTAGFTEVDLTSSLAGALGNLSALIEERSAIIESAKLPVVLGDPGLLVSLWQNLVGNSLKFHGKAAPIVTITAKHRSGVWEFAVTDNGIGIEPRFSERIFVIFQRLHGRDAYDGTGIGLALCKKIVEHHSGRIWLDEQYREGARFRFTLPSLETARSTMAADPAEHAERASSTGGAVQAERGS
jgi:hypothetical protein